MSDGAELHPLWHGAYIRAEHWHFHRQLLKRYGIVLAPGEFSRIARRIARGEAILVEQRSKKRAIYSVRVTSVDERVYILAKGAYILTAWPPEKRLSDLRRARRNISDAESQ